MKRDLAAQLGQLLRPLRNRVSNMVARAVLELVEDSGKLQVVQLQVGEDETRDGVERFQEYGFTSVPHEGAEAVVLFPNGRRDHGLVVAVDDRRYRITGLAKGEVAIYDDLGSRVVLKRDGIIEITAAAKVVIDAPLVEMAGDLTVAGQVTADQVDAGTVVDGGITLGTHTHGAGALVGAGPGNPVTGITGGPQ